MRKVISMKDARGRKKVISNCLHCRGALLHDATMSEFYDYEVFRCFQCSRYFHQDEVGRYRKI